MSSPNADEVYSPLLRVLSSKTGQSKRKISLVRSASLFIVVVCIVVVYSVYYREPPTQTVQGQEIAQNKVETQSPPIFTSSNDSTISKADNSKSKYHLEKPEKPKVELQESKGPFILDLHDDNTEVYRLLGDIRINANSNVVLLYSDQAKPLNSVHYVKPYPRKWDKSLMSKSVGEIILLQRKVPDSLEPWKPERAAPDNDKRTERLKNLEVISYDGTFPVGNSPEWSESVWRFLRAQKLSKWETQTSVFEKQRQEVGKVLLAAGGKLEKCKIEKRAWVVNKKRNLITKKSVKKVVDIEKCDVKHRAEGVLFSAGGYSGNVFHDFNEVIIPLYITTYHLKGEFVMVIEDVKLWWMIKYEPIFRHLSNYPMVRLGRENLSHCFKNLTVGLKYHGNLQIDSKKLNSVAQGRSHGEFQELLAKVLNQSSLASSAKPKKDKACKPKLLLIQRKGNRVVTNANEVVAMARKVGFSAAIFKPSERVRLSKVWQRISSCHVVVGVHGAALTHLLFMRPNTTLIQIVPLGILKVDDEFYGDPAIRFGLNHVKYKIMYNESSLREKFPQNHSVIANPKSVFDGGKGWNLVEKIYLKGQNITIDIARFRSMLEGEFTRHLDLASNCNA